MLHLLASLFLLSCPALACRAICVLSLQAGRPKKSFLFRPFFFNITNVFCAKK